MDARDDAATQKQIANADRLGAAAEGSDMVMCYSYSNCTSRAGVIYWM